MTTRTDAVPRERLVVGAGFGLMVLHNLDEAFWHPEEGGVVNLAMAVLATGAVLLLFPRMNRWVRVGVLGFFGIQGVVAGTVGHLVHIVGGDAVPLDDSGVLFVLGGVVLLVVAVAEARPRRGVAAPEPTDSHRALTTRNPS